MNISPIIPLCVGIVAGALFLIVFVVSAVLTVRNRRIIRKHCERNQE